MNVDRHDCASLVIQLPQLDRVASEDFLLDLFGEFQRIEQLELRDFLFGHQDVGAEQQLVGVADQELAAEVLERRVAGDRRLEVGRVADQRQHARLLHVMLIHEPHEQFGGQLLPKVERSEMRVDVDGLDLARLVGCQRATAV